MNPKAKELGFIYPLVKHWPASKADVLSFWKKMPFDLGIEDFKGNCDLCFKKSDFKLIEILRQNPEKADWWLKMEDKYKHFTPESQPNRPEESLFYRGYKSVRSFLDHTKRYGAQSLVFAEDYGACGSGDGCEED
jgi:hypothetical protein